MTVRALVWDIGNVIVRWNPLALYRQLISDPQKAEWWVTHSFFADANKRCDMGMTAAESGRVWAQAFEKNHPDKLAEYPPYLQLIEAYPKNIVEAHPYLLADSIALRDSLRSTYPTYALTNFAIPNWAPINEAHGGIIDRFDEIVMSGRELCAKPEREIFNRLFARALARHGLQPHEMLFIDDSAANVKGSKEAGMPAIQFISSGQLRHDFQVLGVRGVEFIPRAPVERIYATGLGKLKPLM